MTWICKLNTDAIYEGVNLELLYIQFTLHIFVLLLMCCHYMSCNFTEFQCSTNKKVTVTLNCTRLGLDILTRTA